MRLRSVLVSLLCSTKFRVCLIFSIICAQLSVSIFHDFQSTLTSEITKHFEYSETFKTPLKIGFWLNPKLRAKDLRYRRRFVNEKVVDPQNTKNACFSQEQNCKMVLEHDEKTLEAADAIVFIEFAHYFSMHDLPPNWKKWRRPDQIWIIYIEESPASHPGRLLEVFNWTLSYRQDSDIWNPYGKILQKAKPEVDIMMGLNNNIPLTKWISGKTKLVSSAISHCRTRSKRETLIKQMNATGKAVDIYGSCGNMKKKKDKCSFYGQNCTNYWSTLAAQYKFYLSFENSICEDYITEKFWRTLNVGMVPVVYGGANYTKLAPPQSFVDVNQFDSGEKLMDYLEKVGKDRTEYAKFFEWRKTFQIREENMRYMTAETETWCELCKKLRKLKMTLNEKEIKYKVRKDWWIRLPNSSSYPCKSVETFLKWKL